MTPEYSVRIAWSNEDEAYIAVIDELPGCMADGATQEEALENVRVIAAEWVEEASRLNRQVPRPRTTEDMEVARGEYEGWLRDKIMETASKIADDIMGPSIEDDSRRGGTLGRAGSGLNIRSAHRPPMGLKRTVKI